MHTSSIDCGSIKSCRTASYLQLTFEAWSAILVAHRIGKKLGANGRGNLNGPINGIRFELSGSQPAILCRRHVDSAITAVQGGRGRGGMQRNHRAACADDTGRGRSMDTQIPVPTEMSAQSRILTLCVVMIT